MSSPKPEDSPSIEQMISDLRRAGWTERRLSIWESPTGELFRGPALAWRIACAEARESGSASPLARAVKRARGDSAPPPSFKGFA